MDIELAKFVVKLQKVVRGFLARKRLIATNPQYARISFRNSMRILYIDQDFFEQKSIIEEYIPDDSYWQQAPSPQDKNLSRPSSTSSVIVHHLVIRQYEIAHKPAAPSLSLHLISSSFKAASKPLLFIKEIFEPMIHKFRASIKPQIGIELLTAQLDSYSSDSGYLAGESLHSNFEIETVANFTALKKPICVIHLIKKLGQVKIVENFRRKRQSTEKTDENPSQADDNVKNLNKHPQAAKRSDPGFFIKHRSSKQELLSPYDMVPTNQYWKNLYAAYEELKPTLPALNIGKQIYSTYKDFGFVSDLRHKPLKSSNRLKLGNSASERAFTGKKPSPYDPRGLDKHLVEFFKVKIEAKKDLRKKSNMPTIKREKINDLYKSKF